MTEVLIKKEKLEDGSNIEIERRCKKEISVPAKMRFVKSAISDASISPTAATKGRSSKKKCMPATLDAAVADVGALKLQQQLRNKRKTTSPPATSSNSRHFLPGARCGEIFVANNARQWTFICTFCNTSTRDIGDFICHIKMKHLQESEGYYYNNYDDANTDDIDNNDADDTYEQEQDVSYNDNYAKHKANANNASNMISSSLASNQSSSYVCGNGDSSRNIRFRSSNAIEIIPIRRENAPKIFAATPKQLQQQKLQIIPHKHQVAPPEPQVILTSSFTTTTITPSCHSVCSSNSKNTSSMETHSTIRRSSNAANAFSSTSYPANTEYFDCGNYLDVSVHTDDPAETSYNNGQGVEESFSKSTPVSKARVQQKMQNATSTSAGATAKKIKLATVNNFVVDLVDDADDDGYDDNNKHGNGSSNDHDASFNFQPKFNIRASKQTAKKKTGQVKKIGKSSGPSNGSTSVRQPRQAMDFDEHTNEQYQQNSSNTTTDDYGQPYDDYEDDDDFDNQLLIPNDSMDNSSMGNNNSDVKSKRRQIRGTAYCALCNKTFQYYSLYRNHMIKHSNETPFKCPLCKKGFKSKQAIRYHMNTHQKEKQFQCELCEAGYYTENQFITHVLTHETADIFPCMVCGKILRSDKERDRHVATHTEERPFRCEFCNKLFRLRHHLSNHLKMHRQYRCDYCKEEFTSAVFLRKPYACPVCELSPETRKQIIIGEANPLQLYQTLRAPTECVDLAEMVTDESEGDDDDHDAKQHAKNDDVDDDDNDEEIVPQQHTESDQPDDDEDEEDEAEDDNNLLIPQSSRRNLMEAKKY